MLWTRLFTVTAVFSSALAVPVELAVKRASLDSPTCTFKSTTNTLKGIQSQMASYAVPGGTVGPQMVSLINQMTPLMQSVNAALKPAETNPSAVLLDCDGPSVLQVEPFEDSCVAFLHMLTDMYSQMKDMKSMILAKDGLTESRNQLEAMQESLQTINQASMSSGLPGGLIGGGGGGGISGGLLGRGVNELLTGLLGGDGGGLLGGLLGGGGLL